MHFAMPPRKTSRPPPYAARGNRSLQLKSLLRRDRLRYLLVGAISFLTIVWLFRRTSGGGSSKSVVKKPVIGTGAPVVIVTVIDPNADKRWTESIKQNRIDYAKKYGYETFFPNSTAYELRNSPVSWAKVPAMRHAITLYPKSTYFWYIDPSAVIMNKDLALTSHILSKSKLEQNMIVNQPIVPPDSVIKTFAHLKGGRIDIVITQDKEGLSQSSFVVRNGEWAKYFLDVWFDPIYRSYNFQKAEAHALEHIVQWHGTILAKLGLVPQNLLNSYVNGQQANTQNGQYREGDLIANFPGCDHDGRNCLNEQQPFFDILNGNQRAQS